MRIYEITDSNQTIFNIQEFDINKVSGILTNEYNYLLLLLTRAITNLPAT